MHKSPTGYCAEHAGDSASRQVRVSEGRTAPAPTFDDLEKGWWEE